MSKSEIVVTIFLLLVAVTSFVVGILQLKEKGVLLNNAYLYASKTERERMDKKPHYRQTGIVFILIGIMFLTGVFEMIADYEWLWYLSAGVGVITIIYAVISSINIEVGKKEENKND